MIQPRLPRFLCSKCFHQSKRINNPLPRPNPLLWACHADIATLQPQARTRKTARTRPSSPLSPPPPPPPVAQPALSRHPTVNGAESIFRHTTGRYPWSQLLCTFQARQSLVGLIFSALLFHPRHPSAGAGAERGTISNADQLPRVPPPPLLLLLRSH